MKKNKEEQTNQRIELERSAAVCIQIGIRHYFNGKNQTAIDYYNEAIEHYKTARGGEIPDQHDAQIYVALIYSHIGDAWRAMADYDKASGLRANFVNYEYYQAINFYGKVIDILADNHPSSAKTYRNIGIAYEATGEYDKAIALYEKALSIDLKFLNEKHPDVTRDRDNIRLTREKI